MLSFLQNPTTRVCTLMQAGGNITGGCQVCFCLDCLEQNLESRGRGSDLWRQMRKKGTEWQSGPRGNEGRRRRRRRRRRRLEKGAV